MASLLEVFVTVSAIDKASGIFGKVLGSAEKTGSGIGESFGKAGGIIEKAGATLAAAFTTKKVVEFGVDAVKSAMDVESAFAKVNTLLRDDTDTTAYFNSIKAASWETGVAVTDFAEATYSAISASVDQANAVEFVTQAVKLAKGGFTDVATAVDILTTAQNAYGLSASETMDIANKLITTQNLGKTTVGELAAAMGRVIPTAKSYNVDLTTLSAAYAVLTKNGIQTAESTTYLNGMFNELGKSGTTAANVLKAETGKSFAELMDSGWSLSDVLQILQDEADRTGVSINDMFGSQEAGKAAASLIDHADELVSATAEMQDSAGATEKAYKKMSSTVSEQLQKLKNRFDMVKTAIGEALLPVLSLVVDHFDEIEVAAGTLAAVIGGVLVGQAIVSAQAGFVAVMEAMVAMTSQIGATEVATLALTGKLKAVQVVAGLFSGSISRATAAQAALNAVSSAAPLLLLAAGFVAVAAAVKRGTKAYKEHVREIVGTSASEEEAAAKVKELTDKINELKASAAESGWSDAMTQELANYQNALDLAENDLLEFQKANGKAAESATEPVTAFEEASNQYAADMKTLIENYQQTYESIYSSVTGWYGAFDKASTSVKTSISDIMSNMQSQIDFNNTYNQNLQYLKDVGLGGLSEAFLQYGKDGAAYAAAIVQGLIDVGGATTEQGQAIIENLQSMYGELGESQGDVVKTLADTVTDIDAKTAEIVQNYTEKIEDLNQAKEAKEFGQKTMDGLLQGIQSGVPGVLEALKSLVGQMTDTLQANAGTITFNAVVSTGNIGVGRGFTIRSANAIGLDYVPYNQYPALLHRGEAVLTAEEADKWRRGDEQSENVKTVEAPTINIENAGDKRIVSLLSLILDSIGTNLNRDIRNGNRGVSQRDFARAVRSVG